MRVAALVGAGAALGIGSRVEEIVEGFSAGISSNSTWLLAAAVAGLLAASPSRAALLGAAVLTAANLGYYAWILLTEPATDPTSIAGPPARWFALGIAGGIVLGVAAASVAVIAAIGWRGAFEPLLP